jgi:hypothetical protein
MTGLELLGHIWLVAAFIVSIGSIRATWCDWNTIEHSCKNLTDEV